jgi:hypothetical protein
MVQSSENGPLPKILNIPQYDISTNNQLYIKRIYNVTESGFTAVQNICQIHPLLEGMLISAS